MTAKKDEYVRKAKEAEELWEIEKKKRADLRQKEIENNKKAVESHMMKIERDLKLKEDKRSRVIQKASQIAGSHASQVEKVLITRKAIEKEGPLDLEQMEKVRDDFLKLEKYKLVRVSAHKHQFHFK